MISKKMQSLVANGSAIRAMFEEGKKMAAVYGAENVYDFSLGNPCTPPPESVRKAAVDILMKEPELMVHGYMSNSGYEAVSYTHLDVYKRQPLYGTVRGRIHARGGIENLEGSRFPLFLIGKRG